MPVPMQHAPRLFTALCVPLGCGYSLNVGFVLGAHIESAKCFCLKGLNQPQSGCKTLSYYYACVKLISCGYASTHSLETNIFTLTATTPSWHIYWAIMFCIPFMYLLSQSPMKITQQNFRRLYSWGSGLFCVAYAWNVLSLLRSG